jgi:MoxR-like ATPase
MDGRDYVVPDDVKDLATAVCAHRLLTRALTHDGASAAAEAIFSRILETIPGPQ